VWGGLGGGVRIMMGPLIHGFPWSPHQVRVIHVVVSETKIVYSPATLLN